MFKRILSIVLCLCMVLAITVTANAVTFSNSQTGANTDANSTGAYPTSASDFTWDNASVYFLLTDRFKNGNTANDHSYDRAKGQNGQPVVGNSDAGLFQGGDFKGITQAIKEGYFTNLGINALWISAPYEQAHGYVIGGTGRRGSFAHYAYHGYYVLDYTETDLNFGTEQEFKEMVDTAHQYGIRIVMDIVMNHAAYCTLRDLYEFDYGVLNSGWETDYYNHTLYDQTYSNYINYRGDANRWSRWWGTNWLRAGISGYSEGSGDLQGSQAYLPDFRTESTNTVDIPTMLKTKWTKEGTYNQKINEYNSYFSKTGYQKTVRNSLVFWLSQWVEKYGVDGFRCDTAKHVEMDSWVALKKACTTALQTWRKNNPTAPGANWDEPFWMTGENYGQGVDYNNYYTSGAFDSMINFSFTGGGGVTNANGINNVYSDYANRINNNDKFNVLSYISSHDTALARNNNIYQGSAFQLLPGGIQLFYGDETARPNATASIDVGEHKTRSFMNWNNYDTNTLQHWQKVGQFRNNHVAIGAGSHTSLSATSGIAFARTYNKNGVNDQVFACINANSNTNVTITLPSTVANGTVLKNTYDGTTATVSGGKVTFNSGKNGTILIETTGSSQQPTQAPTTVPTTAPTTAKPTEAPTTIKVIGIYGDADKSGVVNINDVTAIQKHLASLGTLTGDNLTLSDTNKDNRVSIKDATYIQKYIVGINDTAYVNTKLQIIETQPTQKPTEAPTDAPTVPADTYKIYFKTLLPWMTSMGCSVYAYDNSTGESYVMEQDTEAYPNVFIAEVPKSCTNVTLYRAMAAVTDPTATTEAYNLMPATLSETNNCYILNAFPDGGAPDFSVGPYVAESAPEFELSRLYVDNSAAKWDDIYVYGWGYGMFNDTTQMTKIEGTDIWYLDLPDSIPSGVETFLLKNTAGGTEWVKQSANVTITEPYNCYKISATNKGEGTWYTYNG